MKSSTKRLLSLVIVLAMALSLMPMIAFAADTTLYVKPNANWNQSGARFAAYFFGNGETWLDCTDADGDGVYEVVAPAGYPNVIFCRMNPNAAANNWNNKWNQTSDLKVPTDSKICYVVAENTWDKGAGQWVEYTPEGGAGETEPTTASPIKYSVAGVAELCGSGWDPSDINNMMTDEDADGIYTITYANVAAGSYEFKVTDGTWNNSWGKPNSADNYTLVLDAAAETLEIRFDTATNLVEVIIDGETPEPPVTGPTDPSVDPIVPGTQEYCLVGYINGADYGCNDDYENVGEYIFVDGTLTVSFTTDSYIFVKTTDNAKWYMPAAYTTEASATFVRDGGEKMLVPGNAELIFTLVENCEEGTITVSYEIGQQLPTDPTDPSDPSDPSDPVAATYYVAGDFNGWNYKDEAYVMTANGTAYSLDINVTAGKHELKVTNGTWDVSWGAATASGNYEFFATADGTVTVTFDGETVTVTGDCLGEIEKDPLLIESVYAVGSAGLIGSEWDPTTCQMTGVDGVYTVTFENIAAGTYEFKFAANGNWELNWAAGVAMESGVAYDAWKNAMGNSSVVVDADGSSVTLTLDLTTMDIYTGEGGKCSVLVEAPAASGVTVSGTVTTATEGDATVELLNGEEVVATATVSGKEGTYTIEDVAAGTYTLKVSKATHVAREYTVTVAAEAVTQDVKICQIGDVDGSGKINMGDISKLLSHIRGTALITDEYQLACANVNGGSLNMGDISTLYAHIKGTKLLF